MLPMPLPSLLFRKSTLFASVSSGFTFIHIWKIIAIHLLEHSPGTFHLLELMKKWISWRIFLKKLCIFTYFVSWPRKDKSWHQTFTLIFWLFPHDQKSCLFGMALNPIRAAFIICLQMQFGFLKFFHFFASAAPQFVNWFGFATNQSFPLGLFKLDFGHWKKRKKLI